MLLYHGTSDPVAIQLSVQPATVSVSAGGGELGQGFYAGDHIALAAAWAQGRHQHPAVLEVNISASAYVALQIRTLNWAQVVNIWNQLRAAGTTRTYQAGVDVLHGPLATYAHATQHKFESAAAESALRSSAWRKL